jgi:integrase
MELPKACDLALATHWRGMRKEPTYAGWCRDLIETFPDKTLATLTAQDLRTFVGLLEAGDELEPATVYARVSHLRTIYVVAKKHGYKGTVPEPFPYPRVPRKLKWWLNPDQHTEAIQWCNVTNHLDLRDYLNWTVATGLRVEETMRCTRRCFHRTHTDDTTWCLSIPGTKTTGAEATLPLSKDAADVAMERFSALGCLTQATSGALLFSLTYRELWSQWSCLTKALQLPESASLKALRRSYARERAAKGVPLPVLQQMMRHRDPSTTMEYLRLTGGAFTLEEMRRWA